MAWAIQYQTLPFNGLWSHIFNFPDGVSSYIVGFPYFYLDFEFNQTSEHAVQQLGLSLSLGSPPASGQVQSEINVEVIPTLSDASGTTIDLGQSWVMVAVIAWTGAEDPLIMLASDQTVSNDASQLINLPTGTPASGLLPILSGFDLEYASTAYDVETIKVGVSVSPPNQDTAQLGGTASMQDEGGHVAGGSGGSTATITGSLLATSKSSPGFVTQALPGQQSGNPVCVNFDSPLDSAVPLITGFQVQYPGNTGHLVEWISAGTQSWSVNGSTVMLSNAQAQIYDTVNKQDNTKSNVSLVVVGIPSS
jgi:hypothetical protein